MKSNKNTQGHSKPTSASKQNQTVPRNYLSERTTTTNQKPAPGHKK